MTPKTYKTKSAAKAAIKKAALHVLPVNYRVIGGSINPIVTAENNEDAAYIRNHHGFAAVVQKQK